MASIAKSTNLAKNGKYMSGRKDNNVQLESSSAYIRKQTPSKSKDGKTQKAHSSFSEPTITVKTTNTNVQHEKAAELKKNLEREVALGQMNDKKSIKNSSENFSDNKKEKNDPIKGEAENKQKHNKYFAYEKTKNENKYRKRVYKIEKKYKILYSQTPNAKPGFTLFRKLSILNQSVIAPIKRGDPIGVVTAPAAVFIKKKLEKYKLGRIATRTQEAGKRIVSAAENTTDTSQAMSAVTNKAAKEVVKGTTGTVYRYIDRKRQKKLQENKYLKEAAKEEIAQYVTNIRYIKARDTIAEREKAFNEGKASEKLAKKVENFNKKDNFQKKQQKIEKKNQKLEKKIQRNHRPYNSTLKKNIRKTSTAKLLGLLASGGMASIVPIILIILVIAIIATFIFYPFLYITETEESTDDNGNAVTENKITDSDVPDTVRHYYAVMDRVVDKINGEIDLIFSKGDEYNNTGIIDPIKKAKYDADYQYYLDNILYDDSVQEPKKDYWYSEEELYEMGTERGPIFEGYRWSPDTDAHKVPYGNLYDEMLCTIAANNAKLMSQDGNNDIIFMDDPSVEAAYEGGNFWELSNGKVGVNCTSGGACRTKKVPVTIYNDKGEAVGVRYESQKYCPGHYVIMVKLKLNFDLDQVWKSYEFTQKDKDNYDEIYKQLLKDK